MLQNGSSFHFHTCEWAMRFHVAHFSFYDYAVVSKSNMFRLWLPSGNWDQHHQTSLLYPSLKTKGKPQQWSVPRLGLKKTEMGRATFLNISSVLPPRMLWVFGQCDTWTDMLIGVWKECFMTVSHHSHDFKAVLVLGRKCYASPEHKTGLREGVVHENPDVI